jgi:hypothetical protein
MYACKWVNMLFLKVYSIGHKYFNVSGVYGFLHGS